MKKAFPQILHFIWWQGIPNSAAAANIDRWRKLNPGWQVKVWNQNDIEQFIQSEFPDLWRKFRKIPRRKDVDFPDIRKVDCARLLILHRLGGAYFDTDLVPYRSVRSFLEQSETYLKGFSRFDVDHPITVDDLATHHKFVSPGGYDYVVFTDTRPMDAKGLAVINGAMICKPSDDEGGWILDFVREKLERRIFQRRQPVLNSFGSHALARYLRIRKENNGWPKMLTVPGHYVVWDSYVFGQRWPFVLCEHDGKTGGQSWAVKGENLSKAK